ncbi:hypothetical protein AWB75_07101 [Caballeronia catudaia]|uniref:Uncharacterized protein n=1 Tax=Caballeronia catudaia TaxID=1777136 RepID=A0A158DSZ5_9BURK|nr:hypothetical protein [Caballeronia catudaia]SAK97276.1 hypothetical protein AWB75_07101 [Caballeronia catudaia]
MNKNVVKRAILLTVATLGSAFVSSAAFARVDVGVYLGAPAPLYVEQPAVVYQAPPPVVYAPAPAYYGYGYRDEDHGEHWRHDNGRHRGWEHHHHHGDDDD